MPIITSTKEELQERIKELSCLYEISSVIRNHQKDISKTLVQVLEILTRSWRFSEKAIGELKFGQYDFCTEELPENSVWQGSEIKVLNSESGYLRIHYPTPELNSRYFLDEEQKLLEKVSDEISSFFEKQHHKEQEELLRRSAQRNDRLSILGEITAGIAHELNTPMGNILGFAELINGRTENEQTRQDTSKIIKAAIYSREVVKKLMFFACEMPQNMEVLKIKPILTQALSLLGPNFKKAQVDYKLEMEDPGLEAQLDPIQFTQVLFNLLINALYVSPKYSVLQITISSTEDDLFIEIADQGPGIPEDIKPRIFEPFFTTKPVGEGSGLGLSVVHGIVKSHRGQIRTWSNHPTGAVFQIQLPLKF